MLKLSGGLALVGTLTLFMTVGPWAPRGAVAPTDPEGELVPVLRRDVRTHLFVIGDLRPTRSRTISSALSGDQGTIVYLAEDGAPVAEGDLLVRLDRTPFEEALRVAEVDVSQKEGLVDLRGHALTWQEAQALKSIQAAEYEVDLARLERDRFELGEGPLELARLKSEAVASAAELAQRTLFVDELEPLLEQGFVQAAEIEQLESRRDEASRTHELAERQATAYESFIFPSRIAALRVAQDRAAAALAQVQLSVGSKVAEAQAALDLAERNLIAARAQLDEARSNIQRTEILAPTGGMFVLTEDFRNGQRRKPRVGDSVWQGQQIAFLPDLERFEVACRVREVDLHKVAPGHEGLARIDAYPGLELKARVRGLSVLAERDAIQTTEKTFAVTIDLLESSPNLRPGMTARVEIDSGSATDALTIPIHALWEDAGDTWVWVLGDGGELERRPVVVGLRDLQVVEVLEGLDLSDRVSLEPPDLNTSTPARDQ